jgi:transcriptional regulator with AAA-type ATPase domain
MNEALRVANQVAATDANVLLLGETGTGKGVLAAAIHAASPRAQAPMATINCPSLGAEGMEAELFGDARGGNGGVHNPVGRVTYAEGGTVFLDEIGDFPAVAAAAPASLHPGQRCTSAPATRPRARPTRESSPRPTTTSTRWSARAPSAKTCCTGST